VQYNFLSRLECECHENVIWRLAAFVLVWAGVWLIWFCERGLFRCLSVNLTTVFFTVHAAPGCTIPFIIRGSWFSWENGQNTLTEINAETMTRRGYCIAVKEEYHVNYTFVFKSNKCYHCVKFMVRTVNVLEKIESKYTV